MEIEIKSNGGRTHGKHLKFRRVHAGIEITMYGKRGAHLGFIAVDSRELLSTVEAITSNLTPREPDLKAGG